VEFYGDNITITMGCVLLLKVSDYVCAVFQKDGVVLLIKFNVSSVSCARVSRQLGQNFSYVKLQVVPFETKMDVVQAQDINPSKKHKKSDYSLIECMDKDVFYFLCDLFKLPDVFVLRRCSKTLKRKVDQKLMIKFNMFNAVPSYIFLRLDHESGGLYDQTSARYAICCTKLKESRYTFECMYCHYTFCDAAYHQRKDKYHERKDKSLLAFKAPNKKCKTGSVIIGNNNSSKKLYSICNGCITKQKKDVTCNNCNKNLLGTDKWCMCRKCEKLYCNTQECIGYHNATNVSNYTYKEDLIDRLIVECTECVGGCVRCNEKHNGLHCIYCEQYLCDNCAIKSMKHSHPTKYFCMKCAQKML
jgi:hypothetical protein